MKILPINLDDLIHARSVESVRREFKKTWSEQTPDQVIRSVCAFANDFFNLNGGYIVIGIEEKNGLPVLPPEGVENQNLDRMQSEIRGNCRRIEPEYQPVISPEIYQGRHILVIWVPAGDLRPYHAPEKLRIKEPKQYYYVRLGNQTTAARGEILTQLMQTTAKIPFDDRRNLLGARADTLSASIVRNFLSDIKSDLVAAGVKNPDMELYRSLRILARIDGHEVPKNIALLFFVNDPEQFFPGARIEIVQFGDDVGGDLIEEKIFRGPVQLQIRQALDYLNAFSTTMIRKVPNQAETDTTATFPYGAMEEAVVNAVYHRSYEGVPEPLKVYLYPYRMEVISYPGPVPGIEKCHFQKGGSVPPVPNRNRRVGEFLKDLRLAEGRGTGIPKIRRKMSENGSPDPVFEFDESRSYFRVILSAHPRHIIIHSLRESAHLWAVGERQKAIANLKAASGRVPRSGALFAQMIEYHAKDGGIHQARKTFETVEADPMITERHLPYIAMVKVLIDERDIRNALEILTSMPSPTTVDDVVDIAILYKRSDQLQDAHSMFESNDDLIMGNPKAVYEYAQTKIGLAKKLPEAEMSAKKKLTRDGVELFRRAIQLSDDTIRNAWCWYHLAKSLAWLRSPDTEVSQAYGKAMELLPDEERFKRDYERWMKHGGSNYSFKYTDKHK
ncbi:putative DNA binding domain-containing protein [Desulfobacterales bacterium HSG2]|nr:putative DNA binding domain-containing protein [Desulfobacterales bacterium HSG2]